MKTNNTTRITALALVFASVISSEAVDGLSIRPDGTNIVLSWPSAQYKSYAVQFRTTVDSTTTWQTISDNIQATATGTLYYTNLGVVPLRCSGGGSGGGGGGVPPPGLALNINVNSALDSTEYPLLPPLPWDPTTWNANQSGRLGLASGEGMLTAEDSTYSNPEPVCGFYSVIQVPDFMVNVNGASLDGSTFIPVDFGTYSSSLVKTEVLLNGVPTDYGQYYLKPVTGGTQQGIVIFGMRLTNGTYQLQIRTTFNPTDSINETVTPIQFVNKPVTISVSNSVSCLDWEDFVIGNSTTLKATLAVQNADWEIDIYDWDGSIVNYGTGTTSNGQIQWTWDMTDLDGNPRNDISADPQFFPYLWLFAPSGSSGPQRLSQSKSAAASSPKTLPPKTIDFPSVGRWTLAYQDRIKGPGQKKGMEQVMQAIAGVLYSKYSYLSYFYDLEYGPDAQNLGIPASDPNTAQTNRNESWDYLRYALVSSEVRNFYYNGHGSPTVIGGDLDTYATVYTTNYDGSVTSTQKISGSTIDRTNGVSTAYLTTDWVKKNVTTPNVPGIPPHPYRFAFLDGCSTAATWDWSDAFGIGRVQTNSINYYTDPNRKPHLRPGAYVGWAVPVGGDPKWGTMDTYALFRSQWMVRWGYGGDPLLLSLRDANWDSGWITDSLLLSSIRICGYTELLCNEYNTKASWP